MRGESPDSLCNLIHDYEFISHQLLAHISGHLPCSTRVQAEKERRDIEDHAEYMFQSELRINKPEKLIDQRCKGNECNNISSNDKDQPAGPEDRIAEEGEERLFFRFIRITLERFLHPRSKTVACRGRGSSGCRGIPGCLCRHAISGCIQRAGRIICGNCRNRGCPLSRSFDCLAAVCDSSDNIFLFVNFDRIQEVGNDQSIDAVQRHCRQDIVTGDHCGICCKDRSRYAAHRHHGQHKVPGGLHLLDLEF